ncbi:MAG: glycine--tRNA ligase subunit beta [Firmicutes bacterium]|nr:glycine--tRNA ligase subunit beta [Bacillota bacterium]
MQLQSNLLIELSFDGLGYRRVPKAAELLFEAVKQSMLKHEIEYSRSELYFSVRRIVVWLNSGEPEEQIISQSTIEIALGDALNQFKRCLSDCWEQVVNVLALYGDELLAVRLSDFEVANWTPDNTGQLLEITSVESYWALMESQGVLIDNREREDYLRKLLAEGAAELGGEISAESLLNEVLISVEKPEVIKVTFPQQHLQFPEQLLRIVLLDNNVFPLYRDGELICRGLVVVDADTVDDERFQALLDKSLAHIANIYHRDLNLKPAVREQMLRATAYKTGLGSLWDKQKRILKQSITIIDLLDAGKQVEEVAEKAARICKADTVTQVCKHFPQMQGHMGEQLAIHLGEPDVVGVAIREHLCPGTYCSKLPHTLVGAVLGIADRLDDICGYYHLDELSFSRYREVKQLFDQIIQIVDSVALDLSLARLLRFSLSLYESQGLVPWQRKDLDKLLKIFLERLGAYLRQQNYGEKSIRALLAVRPTNVYTAIERVKLLDSGEERDLVDDCIAVAAMVEKNCPRGYNYEESAREFLETSAEKDLFELLLVLKDEVESELEQRKFRQALAGLARLKNPLARFTESVHLDFDDMPVTMNRLGLLSEIRELLWEFADFTKLEPTEV